MKGASDDGYGCSRKFRVTCSLEAGLLSRRPILTSQVEMAEASTMVKGRWHSLMHRQCHLHVTGKLTTLQYSLRPYYSILSTT